MSRTWMILVILLAVLLGVFVVVAVVQLNNTVRGMIDALDTCRETNASLAETIEIYEETIEIYQNIAPPVAE